MSNTISINVEAAISKNDKWLLCVRSMKEEHAAGLLSLIGGTVEYIDLDKSTLESALIREISEEIGVTISVTDYIQSTSFVTKTGSHVIDIVFLCSIVDGALCCC